MNRKWLNILGILGLFVAGSIGGQLGLEAARAAFWQWSSTAINNQTADPTINWSEGQSPSSVNDSGRAMMARLVEQAKDTSGALTTTGGPTAYTVTTNQGFQTPTPVDGQVIGLSVNVTNAVNPTLAVDGGTAYPIQVQPGTGAPADTLAVGVPYTMKYSAANNAWLMRDTGSSLATAVPIGALVLYTGTVVPNANYVFANGQCLSTTTYAVYWAFLGSPGVGTCAAGQFRVIDLQGRVPAGIDAMGGAAATNRLTSSTQGCGAATTAIGSVCATAESHTMAVGELAAHFHGAPMYDPGHWHQLPYADPGHFHTASPYDPTHAHSAAIYDLGHGHNFNSSHYGTTSLVQAWASSWNSTSGIGGGGAFGPPENWSVVAAGTGVRVWNGGTLDVTYAAGTGFRIWDGANLDRTYVYGTGVTFYGSGGTGVWSDYAKATGVRILSPANSYDETNTTGSSTPFSVVQPTITVSYLIRVL